MPNEPFGIQLHDESKGMFFPGSTISGTLMLETKEAKNYLSIQVVLTGEARVNWRRASEAREEFIKKEAVLWDKNAAGGGQSLPKGSYRWPFSFVFEAPKLPPSHTCSSNGGIYYALEGRIIREGSDKIYRRTMKKLTVGNHIQIDRPECLKSVNQRKEGHVSTLLCTPSGEVELGVTLPRSAYCIEQDAIPFEVAVQNHSGRAVKRLVASIKRLARYTAKDGTSLEEKELAVSIDNGRDKIPAGGSTTWRPSPLEVPSMTVSCNCSIIAIEYLLRIEAVVFGSTNPAVEVPIFLGSIPLEEKIKKKLT